MQSHSGLRGGPLQPACIAGGANLAGAVGRASPALRAERASPLLLCPCSLLQPANYATYGAQCLMNLDDPLALACMTALIRSLITATCASSLISTFFIGYFGNLPLALAPGIGE